MAGGRILRYTSEAMDCPQFRLGGRDGHFCSTGMGLNKEGWFVMSKMSLLKRIAFVAAVSGTVLYSGACTILSYVLPSLLGLVT